MIYFGEDGRIYIQECSVCSEFPLENIEESCMNCGYSQKQLIELEKYVNQANRAIDLMSKYDDDSDESKSKELYLHLSGIKLGDGLDQILFTDIDQTNGIRKLADFAERMCTVVVYPTNIRHIEVEFVDDDDIGNVDFWEDE